MKCPFCKQPIKEIFSSTSCVNTNCVFGHKMMTKIEWEEIESAISSANREGYEQAREQAAAVVESESIGNCVPSAVSDLGLWADVADRDDAICRKIRAMQPSAA